MSKRIIKSFKELKGLNRREFYKNGKLIPIDRKYAVSMARQLAEGFDNIDLSKKPPSKYQYQKARKVIDTWFDATRSGKSIVKRPSKRNRSAYAEFSDMPDNFKIYLMPVIEKDDKFKIKKTKTGRKVVRSGKNITTNDYLFPDRVEAMKNTEKETGKLLKKIDKDYKGKIRQLFIRVGRHETKVKYPVDTAAKQIEQWTMQYGIEKTQKFVMGLRVFSFNGQEVKRPSRLKLKKGKK